MSIYRSISAPRLSEAMVAASGQDEAPAGAGLWIPTIVPNSSSSNLSSEASSVGNSPTERSVAEALMAAGSKGGMNNSGSASAAAVLSTSANAASSSSMLSSSSSRKLPLHFSHTEESVYAYLTEDASMFISQDDPVLNRASGSNAIVGRAISKSSSSDSLAAAASAVTGGIPNSSSASNLSSGIPNSSSGSNLTLWGYGSNAENQYNWYGSNVLGGGSNGGSASSSSQSLSSNSGRPVNAWNASSSVIPKVDSNSSVKSSGSASNLHPMQKSFKAVASSASSNGLSGESSRNMSSGRLSDRGSRRSSNSSSSSNLKDAAGRESKSSSSWLQSSSDEVEIFLCNSYINDEVDHILYYLQPSEDSEKYRSAIVRFVENVVKRNLGAKIFPQGSFASKTYLPDSDLNIAAFFTHNHQRTWIQRVIKSLLKEDMPRTNSKGALNLMVEEENLPPAEDFNVRSASFLKSSHLGQIIKAQVEDLSLEISANQTQCLSAVALLEEVDRLVGKDHLFKRTILLTKAWASYEARILGPDDGLLNSYCIIVMLMFIFNAFHAEIETPLQGLWKLIEYTAKFEWEKYGWTLYGAVSLSANPAGKGRKSSGADQSLWPAGVEPLIPQSVIARYAAPASDDLDGDVPSQKARYFVLLDPRDSNVNLGSNFTRHSAVLIRQAFVSSAKSFRQHISAWFASRHHRKAVLSIFKNTMQRFKLIDAPRRSFEQISESFKLLDGNLAVLVQQMMNAAEFDIPDITEEELVDLMKVVLEENSGVVTVGKMGSLMHAATNNHSLPAMLKAKYGGLKKLLRRHPSVFFIASDHPHNPRVYLRDAATGLPADGIPSSFSSPVLYQTANESVGSSDPRSIPSAKGIDSNHSSPFGSPRMSSFAGTLMSGVSSAPSLAQYASVGYEPVESKSSPYTFEMTSSSISLTVPNVFVCPLTKRVLSEPVVAADGVTYEKSALERWRVEHGNVSPITGESIDLSIVFPNSSLQHLLQLYQKGLLDLRS